MQDQRLRTLVSNRTREDMSNKFNALWKDTKVVRVKVIEFLKAQQLRLNNNEIDEYLIKTSDKNLAFSLRLTQNNIEVLGADFIINNDIDLIGVLNSYIIGIDTSHIGKSFYITVDYGV